MVLGGGASKCLLCYYYFLEKVSVISVAVFPKQNSRCKKLDIHRDLRIPPAGCDFSRAHIHSSCTHMYSESPVGLLELEWFGTSKRPQSVKPTAAETLATSQLGLGEKVRCCPKDVALGVQRALPALLYQLLICFWTVFPCVSNSDDIKWITATSPDFCNLRERREIQIREKDVIVENREGSSNNSCQGRREKALLPFSIRTCEWRK